MFTRCQGCHTVHPINAALLARANGRYRCGKCRKLGNALDALFDAWPDAGSEAPGAGEVPELGAPLNLARPPDPELSPEESALFDEAEAVEENARKSNTWLRVAWIAGLIVLAVVIVFSVSEFMQKPLLEQPAVKEALVKAGLREPPPEEPFRDLEKIELVNRQLRSHPIRPGVLQLTATIVNRAVQPQPYPDIEITLLDINNEQVSQRVFKPGDYLTTSAELRVGMSPNAYLPFSVDLVDPGRGAIGFELEFR